MTNPFVSLSPSSSDPAVVPTAESAPGATGDSAFPNRRSQTRIRLRIPKTFQQEPVISNIVSRHQLTVNIQAALLGADARADGWFDLDLQGQQHDIQEALHYINDLGLEIWHESEPETW